ncbi:MAG: aldehyde dehydrogenase family protein, partial [Chloroflexota bacterium]
YGLSASIFSRNLNRAEELAQQIDSGDVSINRAQYATATPSVPTGGQRTSGSGRRNGKEGLLKYTAAQTVIADNLIGAQNELQIATPFVVQLLKTLRLIRRYVPFI